MKTQQKTYSKDGSKALGKFLGIVFLSFLLGWWMDWLVFCYTGKDTAYLLSVAAYALVALTIPNKILWIPTLLMVFATIGVWFGFA